MSQPAGALAPSQPIQGVVLRPGTNDTISARSTVAHRFLTVVEDLIRRTPYHHEAQKLDALDAVASYRKHVVDAADAHRIVGEDDVAPVEDVRLRKPPGGAVVPVPTGPAIDYNQLAAALIRAQQQAQAEQAAPAPVPPAASGVLPQ